MAKRSIKDNIAQNQVVTISSVQLKIKDIIVQDLTTGVSRDQTEAKLSKIINSVNLNNPVLNAASKRTLNQFSKNIYFQLSTKIKGLSKNYQKDMEQTEPSYKVDLQNGFNPIQEYTKFRPFIDNSPKGLAVIDNYREQVKDTLKELASETPIVTRKRVDGSTYKISLRNLAEVRVRYEANSQDLENFTNQGIDLVWTSSHADSSGRCQPFQGKLYSVSGKTGVVDGNSYTPLDDALRGLDNDGNGIISGYNCRHRLVPYQQGMKPPTDYDEATIKKERALDQKQRNYENRIRNLKQEEKLLRSVGENEQASLLRSRWQQLNQEYEGFSLTNGRAFYRWRTVLDPSELSSGNLSLSPQGDVAPIDPELLKLNPASTIEIKTDGIDKLGIEKVTAVKAILSNADNNTKLIWNRYENILKESVFDSKYHPYYSPEKNIVVMDIENDSTNSEKEVAYETLTHEYGHLVDFNYAKDNLTINGVKADLQKVYVRTNDMIRLQRVSLSNVYQSKKYKETITVYDENRFTLESKEIGLTIDQMLKKEFETYYNQQKDILTKEFNEREQGFDFANNFIDFAKFSGLKKINAKAVYDYISHNFRRQDYKTTGNTHDIFEGITKAKVTGKGGHGKDYWRDGLSLAHEFFAHAYAGKTTNPESYENIKKYFPQSVDIFEEMLEAINNNEEIDISNEFMKLQLDIIRPMR
jgi:hypothetical protein